MVGSHGYYYDTRIVRDVLFAQLQPPHFDEILRYFRYALLAFVDREVGPMNEFIVDLDQTQY